jgi:hypothetical protein
VKDDKLRLETSGHGDLLLEQWAIARKAKMFRTTFDLEVEVDAVSLGPALI